MAEKSANIENAIGSNKRFVGYTVKHHDQKTSITASNK
ncbi:hypothetical protein FHS86_002070 [Roseimarinus sediminis]